MITTLDEIIGFIRAGRPPKQVAAELGVSERYLRNRFQSAGRLSEYENVVRDAAAGRARSVDVAALMALADGGMTLNQACVDCGYTRKDAMRRLEDEGRVGEFYIRSQEARNGRRVPVVDSSEYHSGPRAVLVSLIPGLDDAKASEVRAAIAAIDAMVRDGAALSRLCGGAPE